MYISYLTLGHIATANKLGIDLYSCWRFRKNQEKAPFEMIPGQIGDTFDAV
jgi:hypothetical protein